MNPKEVFNAEAEPLHELFITGGGVAGFRIPIYQRTYDWGKDNIKRLFEDISSGLSWRNKDENSLTFIGTVIFVIEDTEESDFDGKSLSVIDGQQRLTTITLIATQLFDTLNFELELLKGKIDNEIYSWLYDEVDVSLRQIQDLTYGTIRVSGGQIFPFPRVVREHDDERAKSKKQAEFQSVIGKYLNDFSWYVIKEKEYPFKPHINVESEGGELFKKNLEFVKEFIKELKSIDSSDLYLPKLEDFKKRGFTSLFKKLTPDKKNQIVTSLINEGDVSLPVLRLLTFSNYFMECVITTVVTTKNEKYAFEIFDSLNTTGEPLTAIQTFKPQVIRFEKDYGKGYIGSNSESHFKKIEEYIDSFSTSDQKQNESKELIIPFALYLTGEKISKSLDMQRSYLRNNYNQVLNIDQENSPRKFVKLLSEIVDYKDRFWDSKNLAAQVTTAPDRSTVLLCLKFVKDMNMSLTIPIMSRFYFEALRRDDLGFFSDAVKALTAFIVLRRASTGGTKGIDSDLRGLMSDGGRLKKSLPPLCHSIKLNNEVVEIEKFKSYLKEWLSKNRIEITDKKSWMNKVTQTGIAASSRHLSRFLILSSMHHTRPHEQKKWELEKTKKSAETDYLNYEKWTSETYATIEHIAPERPQSGWDEKIYTEPYLKDSLGNLTILPQKENAYVANKDWSHKKLIYSAFLAENADKLNEIIKKASKEGFSFSKRNKKLLDEGEQLPLFRPIIAVEDWTPEIIKKRTENIASLAWDRIAPWLFENND